MDEHLDQLPRYIDQIKEFREIIIANIVLIGQTPSPTFEEETRAGFILERMAEMRIDECSADGFGNSVGVIRGLAPEKPPIFVVAHIDTFFNKNVDYNYTVTEKTITLSAPRIAFNVLDMAPNPSESDGPEKIAPRRGRSRSGIIDGRFGTRGGSGWRRSSTASTWSSPGEPGRSGWR